MHVFQSRWRGRWSAVCVIALLSVCGGCNRSEPLAADTAAELPEAPQTPAAETAPAAPVPKAVAAEGAAARPARPSPANAPAALDAEATPRETGVGATSDAPEKTATGSPIEPNVRAALARMVDAYRTAKSYEDKAKYEIVVRLQSGPLSVRFERDGKLDASVADARVVSDGSQRTVYLPRLQQHVRGPADQPIDPANVFGETIPRESISPLGTASVPLRLLLDPDPWAYVLEGVVDVNMDEQPAQIDGRPHDVIRLDRKTSDAVIYVDRASGLLRRIEVDLTDSLVAAGQRPEGVVLYVLDIENAVANPPSRPFDFTPPKGSKAVPRFELPKAAQPATPAEPEARPGSPGEPPTPK